MEFNFIIARFNWRVTRYRIRALNTPKSDCHFFRRCTAIVMDAYAKGLELQALHGHPNAAELSRHFAAITEFEIALIDPHWRRDSQAIHALLANSANDPLP